MRRGSLVVVGEHLAEEFEVARLVLVVEVLAEPLLEFPVEFVGVDLLAQHVAPAKGQHPTPDGLNPEAQHVVPSGHRVWSPWGCLAWPFVLLCERDPILCMVSGACLHGGRAR